jgi:hypothetical protein
MWSTASAYLPLEIRAIYPACRICGHEFARGLAALFIAIALGMALGYLYKQLTVFNIVQIH